MPYDSIDRLPAFVKRRDKKEQAKWLAVYQESFRTTACEADSLKAANRAINLSNEHVNGAPIVCFASTVFPDWDAAGVYQVQVIRTGLWKDHPLHGDILVTGPDLAEAVRNFRGSSLKPFLDYNHGVTSGKTKEEREAIGWMRDMWIETLDGARLEPVEAEASKEKVLVLKAEYEVNEDANERIKKKAYALYSPTWYRVYQNEETGEIQGMTVIGGAATNVPHINGMESFIAIAASRDQVVAFAEMLPKASLCVIAPVGMEVATAVSMLDALGYKLDSLDYGCYRVRTSDTTDLVKSMKALQEAGFTITSFYQGYVENARPTTDANGGTTEAKTDVTAVTAGTGVFEIECAKIERPEVTEAPLPA